MHTSTAYDRRATLTDNQLDRLKTALQGEVESYRAAIRGYSKSKMEQYGRPYLADLQARVAEVEKLLTQRARSSNE